MSQSHNTTQYYNKMLSNVKKCGWDLQHVNPRWLTPNQYLDIALEAVNTNFDAIQHLQPAYLGPIGYDYYGFALEAIKQTGGEVLKFVNPEDQDRFFELTLEAIQTNPGLLSSWCMRHIGLHNHPDRYFELVIKAAKKNTRALQYVDNSLLQPNQYPGGLKLALETVNRNLPLRYIEPELDNLDQYPDLHFEVNLEACKSPCLDFNKLKNSTTILANVRKYFNGKRTTKTTKAYLLFKTYFQYWSSYKASIRLDGLSHSTLKAAYVKHLSHEVNPVIFLSAELNREAMAFSEIARKRIIKVLPPIERILTCLLTLLEPVQILPLGNKIMIMQCLSLYDVCSLLNLNLNVSSSGIPDLLQKPITTLNGLLINRLEINVDQIAPQSKGVFCCLPASAA